MATVNTPPTAWHMGTGTTGASVATLPPIVGKPSGVAHDSGDDVWWVCSGASDQVLRLSGDGSTVLDTYGRASAPDGDGECRGACRGACR